jgi:hypothetical protein
MHRGKEEIFSRLPLHGYAQSEYIPGMYVFNPDPAQNLALNRDQNRVTTRGARRGRHGKEKARTLGCDKGSDETLRCYTVLCAEEVTDLGKPTFLRQVLVSG